MNKSSFAKTALLCLFLLGSISTFAQSRAEHGSEGPVQLGSVILNLGIGPGANYSNSNYNSAFGTKVALEFGLWQVGPGVITLGGELGGSWSKGGYNSNYEAHTIVLAARSAWHCGWGVPGLDTYGGVSLGPAFKHESYDANSNGTDASYTYNSAVFAPGIFVGASYFISPGFGFNAEAGYDITNIQIGVVFKLN